MLRVAREALAANETAPEATLKHVIAVLRRDFGRHVVTDEPWVLNNAGGAMGAFKRGTRTSHISFRLAVRADAAVTDART
eukprot:IDg20686t1